MCIPVYVSNSKFCENGKFRMKCVEKFLDILIDHRNLL